MQQERQGPLEARAAALFGRPPFALLDELGAEGGDEREGHEERCGHGRRDDDGQGQVEDLELALEKGEAEEDRYDRQGRGQDGDEDLPGPWMAASRGVIPAPAGGGCSRRRRWSCRRTCRCPRPEREGQHVERDLEGVDEVESDDDGEGDRGHDEQGRIDPPRTT